MTKRREQLTAQAGMPFTLASSIACTGSRTELNRRSTRLRGNVDIEIADRILLLVESMVFKRTVVKLCDFVGAP